MLQLGILCCASFTLVTCKTQDELFQSFMKSQDKLKSLNGLISTSTLIPPYPSHHTTLEHPTSYAMVESAEVTPATAKVNETINDSNTESPLQACFNEIAAENFPRMLSDMENMTSAEIKEHPVYKAFYYTANKAGHSWRTFYKTIRTFSPTQIRDSLKLVNTFSKISKKGGLDETDKDFLQNYQKDLFKDFQMLNSINLTDKDKEQIAGHYKKQEPHFLQENEKLQERLENVMQKFSSDEIRNDPGLRNMRHVGLDPEQFVTLKYMVEDRINDERQMNRTLMDMIDANRGPQLKTTPSVPKR